MRKTRQAKPKQVAYEFIDPTSVAGHPMYVLLTELVSAHHTDIAGARIALAWALNWNPDADGRVKLGMCKRASDLDRELAAFDFVILLRRSFWLDQRVTDAQRAALLDHELTHATVKLDKHGEPARDSRDRLIYRTRRHDLEEFHSIVERYGMWTSDIERFAAALRKSKEPFTPCEQCAERHGWVNTAADGEPARLTRCGCWLAWSEHRSIVDAEDAAERAQALGKSA
jgi:hypothetical protein